MGAAQKGEWLIRYRLGYSDYDEGCAVLPNVTKLLLWIAKYGSRCCEVSIIKLEE